MLLRGKFAEPWQKRGFSLGSSTEIPDLAILALLMVSQNFAFPAKRFEVILLQINPAQEDV